VGKRLGRSLALPSNGLSAARGGSMIWRKMRETPLFKATENHHDVPAELQQR
jgi:hypothetical protein